MESETKKIVLLGSTGFIGTHLLKSFNKNFTNIDIQTCDLAQCDLTESKQVEQLSDLFDAQTVVIMCSFIKRQMGESLDIYEKNVQMTKNMCRVLTTNPVKKFIYFSSAAVYGEDVENLHIDENTAVCPKSYYGMAKFSSEMLLRKVFENNENNSLMCLRPATIYGPGDMKDAYGPNGFLNKVVNDQPIQLWGDGSELREFVFIDDVVKIVTGLIDKDFSGTLNIVSGTSYTFKDALDIVFSITEKEVAVNSKPRSKNKVDQAFNNQRLQKLFPELKFTSLREGIQKIYESTMQNQGVA